MLIGDAASAAAGRRRRTGRASAIPTQLVFFVVIATYVVVLALIGGAVLARYMLTAVPLVIILAVSTLRRRFRYWPAAVAIVAIAFVIAWFWNPPYGFSPEDNLAYRDYVDPARGWRAIPRGSLSDGARSDRVAGVGRTCAALARICHAPGASRADRRFFIGRIAFGRRFPLPLRSRAGLLDQIRTAAPALERWKVWTDLKRKFFGYHRDLPPAAAAQILGGRIVFSEERKGQWIAVIEIHQEEILSASVQ